VATNFTLRAETRGIKWENLPLLGFDF